MTFEQILYAGRPFQISKRIEYFPSLHFVSLITDKIESYSAFTVKINWVCCNFASLQCSVHVNERLAHP